MSSPLAVSSRRVLSARFELGTVDLKGRGRGVRGGNHGWAGGDAGGGARRMGSPRNLLSIRARSFGTIWGEFAAPAFAAPQGASPTSAYHREVVLAREARSAAHLFYLPQPKSLMS